MNNSHNLINISNQFKYSAKHSFKEYNKNLKKLKRAVNQRNEQAIKSYAEIVIIQQKQYDFFLKWHNRVEGIIVKIEAGRKMTEFGKTMKNVVEEMSMSLKITDVEQMQELMSDFESNFKDFDGQVLSADTAMQNILNISANNDEVQNLISSLNDEQDIEFGSMFPELASTTTTTTFVKDDNYSISSSSSSYKNKEPEILSFASLQALSAESNSNSFTNSKRRNSISSISSSNYQQQQQIQKADLLAQKLEILRNSRN
jgi:hypothetical protein